MKYPYPTRQWNAPNQYPVPDKPSKDEWAWEFLRRNPNYQRLWGIFSELPDATILEDGSETVKNGKWKGTPPETFRFLNDGAYWYADPEPEDGESLSNYLDRTEGAGKVQTFADYLTKRFHLFPTPRDPKEGLAENDYFTGEWGDDELPPHYPTITLANYSSPEALSERLAQHNKQH